MWVKYFSARTIKDGEVAAIRSIRMQALSPGALLQPATSLSVSFHDFSPFLLELVQINECNTPNCKVRNFLILELVCLQDHILSVECMSTNVYSQFRFFILFSKWFPWYLWHSWQFPCKLNNIFFDAGKTDLKCLRNLSSCIARFMPQECATGDP